MRQHITRRVGILLATVALALTVPLAAFASHQFTDVPNSNLYHADVDALVDSGVTSGCGGGRYCPNNFVTRGEMAAFMNRLGALAPGKTPVVNATRVDGYNSASLSGIASKGGNTAVTLAGTDLGAGATDLGTITATPAANGAILYTFSAWIRCSGAEEDELQLYVNGSATTLFNVEECIGIASDRSISATFVQAVTAGVSYTFQMRGNDFNGAPNNISVRDARSTLLFSPFGVGTAGPVITADDGGPAADGSGN